MKVLVKLGVTTFYYKNKSIFKKLINLYIETDSYSLKISISTYFTFEQLKNLYYDKCRSVYTVQMQLATL